jgi:hypothetical protein
MKHAVFLILTCLSILFSWFLPIFNTLPNWHVTGQELKYQQEGLNIDIFTQKGGEGNFNGSPPFSLNDEVTLYANVTYAGWPEQNKFVAFQIFKPYGETYILYGETNGSGVALETFRLPSTETTENFGFWQVLATVAVAETVVNDTLEFHVRFNLADANGDLKVDIYDIVLAGKAYHAKVSDPNWNVNCDVAKLYDIVDIHDLVVFGREYGKNW